jgi:glycine betaine/choline ABC-type transport system substrate-binding protein
MSDDENFFLDIQLSALVLVDSEEKDAAVEEVNRLLSRVLKKRNVLNLKYKVNLLSETDLQMSMADDDLFEN